MALTPTSAVALEAILDKRFKTFEDRTCLLFCQMLTGISNRITKESNIQARHLMDILARLSDMEPAHENQHLQHLLPTNRKTA